MQLAPDTLLQNRYRIVRLLARGGMGAVYEAVDQRLGNTVALKQTLVAAPHLRAAFEREARLLASLQHPTLPVVHDHFAEGDGQFLVMQFIPGDDLGQLLSRQGSFPPATVLAWGDDLLDALDYLHTQSPPVIHRDIKPQNLKLTPRGRVMLLDFGLAKGGTGPLDPAPVAASIFGYTPQYAPLEQIQGSGTDARSDLYALAATLYHLLTGAPPPNALERASAVLGGQPDPLPLAHTRNSAVTPAVAAILHQAMALDQERRFASAAALRAALRDALQSEPAVNSSGKTTVALAPPLEATLAASAPARSPTAEEPRVVPPAERRFRVRSGVLLLALLALLLLGGVAFVGRFGTATPPLVAATNAAAPSHATPPPGADSTASADPDIGTSRSNPFPFNTLVAIPGWEFQVLEIVRGREAWNRVYEANANNAQPPEGMEYLLLRIRVRNIASDAAARKADKYLFRVTGDRLIDYNWAAVVEPAPRLEAELAPGAETTGWAGYLIGLNEGNLMLITNDRNLPNYLNQRRFVALEEGASLSVSPELREILPSDLGVDPAAPARLGDTVVSEDWEVTVLQVERGDAAWQRVYAGNRFNKPPEPGMEYLALQVRVRYIGTKDERVRIAANDFQIYDSQGRSYRAPSVVNPLPRLETYLFPGGVAEGWAVMQAPVDDAGALLVFKPSFQTSDINRRYLALGE